MITIPLLYTIGRRLFDETFGMIWAMAYLSACFPGSISSGIIDPSSALFIFLSLVQFVRCVGSGQENIGSCRQTCLVLPDMGCCIRRSCCHDQRSAVALLVISLCMAVFWVMERFRFYVSVLHYLLFVLVSLLVSGLWYGTETMLAPGSSRSSSTIISACSVQKMPDMADSSDTILWWCCSVVFLRRCSCCRSCSPAGKQCCAKPTGAGGCASCCGWS